MPVQQASNRSCRRRSLAEAFVWTGGLLAVALADPHAPPLIETCLLKAIGLSFCPGCGLGHAVGFLARGEFVLAVQTHPFAPVAVGVLLHRIVELIRLSGREIVSLREIRLTHVQSH